MSSEKFRDAAHGASAARATVVPYGASQYMGRHAPSQYDPEPASRNTNETLFEVRRAFHPLVRALISAIPVGACESPLDLASLTPAKLARIPLVRVWVLGGGGLFT